MRPYSSEAVSQTPPRKGAPQDVEKRQKRTEMAQQQRSATPSRPVHPQDRDASPRATASTTASRSPSGEPCTPINAERPPVVAKTPSKPVTATPQSSSEACILALGVITCKLSGCFPSATASEDASADAEEQAAAAGRRAAAAPPGHPDPSREEEGHRDLVVGPLKVLVFVR